MRKLINSKLLSKELVLKNNLIWLLFDCKELMRVKSYD